MPNNSTQAIQNISVPSFSKVSKPEPHLVYNLSISLPSRSYTIQQRYSNFTQLEQTLSTSCGATPPCPLPPKHPASWLNPFRIGSNNLSDDQVEERRVGLERWLRAILADRDPRWRSSKAFKEFLLAPPEEQLATATSWSKEISREGLETLSPEREWTSSGWTEEFKSLEDAARQLRRIIDERDSQLLAHDSTAHSSAKTAQASLVDIVTRLGALAKGLEFLALKGMTDGEISRRSDMVQRMQGELEDLGRKTGNVPRIGTGRQGANGREGGASEPPSVARQALLGSSAKATTRVLGTAAPAPETSETRPLDNQGIMQLQQQYMDDQDSKLESLTAALRRQRHLGEMINQELALQEDVIDQLERGTDKCRSLITMLGDNAQQLVVESHRSIQTRSLLPYNTNTVRTVIRESHNLADSISTSAAPYVGTQGAQPSPGVSAELLIAASALQRNKRALYVYHQQRVETIKDKFWEHGGVASNVFAQGMETRQNMTTFDEAFAKGYSDLCLQFKTSWYRGVSSHERSQHDFMEDEDEEEEEAVQLMDAVDLFGGGTAISPPKDLMVDVRVIKDMGEVELLSGNRISLEKGKQYFLPREDVEAMVVSGAVELVE